MDITHAMLLDNAERLRARELEPAAVRRAFDPLRVIWCRAIAMAPDRNGKALVQNETVIRPCNAREHRLGS